MCIHLLISMFIILFDLPLHTMNECEMFNFILRLHVMEILTGVSLKLFWKWKGLYKRIALKFLVGQGETTNLKTRSCQRAAGNTKSPTGQEDTSLDSVAIRALEGNYQHCPHWHQDKLLVQRCGKGSHPRQSCTAWEVTCFQMPTQQSVLIKYCCRHQMELEWVEGTFQYSDRFLDTIDSNRKESGT